jgi:hypothetical protein
MPKLSKYHHQVGASLLVALAALTTVVMSACDSSELEQPTIRADIVAIDSLSAFGHLDRAPVLFPHDQHTEALDQQDRDCETCHMRMENGRLSLLFKRLEDTNRESLMELYHDQCIDCHNETATTGAESGPTLCGDCHRVDPQFVSSRQPIGFDRSLHERHRQGMEAQCGQCHHVYDEETEELYYAEGEETTCRYCHLAQAVDDTPSLSDAAHWACISCHLTRPDAGPTDCAGCHDSERQQQIEIVDNPERLDRGQPDFVLLRANNLDSSKVATVPFSHVEHEDFNTTCRVCHHKDMKPCVECHTLSGSDDSQGVTLQQAMHAMRSDHSCIGCHNLKKQQTACAGCHSLMEQGRLTEHSCTICHAGPTPATVTTVEDRYSSLAQFSPSPASIRLSFGTEDIPDTVTIATLEAKYEPVQLPHRQIIQKLMEHISDSKIATYFHGHEDVVCQGCHHHTPIGTPPPLCESCHGEPFNEAEPFKPGLLGAYHRQCLGCHQSMQIEEPAECEGCHAAK